jgi:hypothetical protein
MLQGLLLVVLYAAGLWAAHAAARKWTADRTLASIVAGAFLLRALLAFGLYYSSLWQLPLMRDLQIGQGFWAFAPDSAYYHGYARGAAVAWNAGFELPFVFGTPEYPLLVTFTYALLGAHPLFPIWINILLATATVVLGYDLSRRLFDERSAAITAALLAFWPSAVLWSVQLLRDAIVLLLIVGFLWAFDRLVVRFEARHAWSAWMASLAAACGALMIAARFRLYVSLLLLASAVAAMMLQGAAAMWRRQYWRMAAAALLAASLVSAVWIAMWFPMDGGPAKRRNPQPGLWRLAEHMASTGDSEGALWQLRAAFLLRADEIGGPARVNDVAALELQRLLARHATTGGGDRRVTRAEDSTATGDWRQDDLEVEAPMDLAGRRIFQNLSLSSLTADRRAYFDYGGSTFGGRDDAPRNLLGLISGAPRAFAATLLSPNPWTRYTTPGTTGVLREVAVSETLLLVPLLCFGAAGLAASLRTTWQVGLTIACFAVTLAVGLGYAVPNIGGLFRLRLGVVVCVSVVAGHGMLAIFRRATVRPPGDLAG